MELRKGYRQTEVGIIPSDWEIKELGKVGYFSKGSGVRKDESLSGNIPCVRYGELYTRHNDYIKQFYSFISEDISKTAKKLKQGDILFAGSGETKGEIGKSAAFIDEFDAYAGGDIVIFSPNNVVPLYLGYLLNAPFIQKQKASKGQGDAVVHISAAQLSILKIPLPPTKTEQSAIATALSDMDELIAQTEKLIEKKKAIKQGVMQELLRPKEGWVTKKLGELCTIIKSGGTPLTSNNEFYNGNIPFLSIGDMTSQDKYLFYTSITISNKGLANSSSWIVPTNSIIYSMYASVGFVSINKIELAISQAVLGIKFKDDISLDFMYYILSSMQKSVFKFVGEGTQKNLNARTVKGFEITLPDFNTQIFIAHTLSDIDKNIFILKSKLQKLKHQKQGMMQALLTGKIRLI